MCAFVHHKQQSKESKNHAEPVNTTKDSDFDLYMQHDKWSPEDLKEKKIIHIWWFTPVARNIVWSLNLYILLLVNWNNGGSWFLKFWYECQCIMWLWETRSHLKIKYNKRPQRIFYFSFLKPLYNLRYYWKRVLHSHWEKIMLVGGILITCTSQWKWSDEVQRLQIYSNSYHIIQASLNH